MSNSYYLRGPSGVDRAMRIIFGLILSLLFCSVEAQNIYSEYKWAERDEWQQPEKIIDLLRVAEGSVVADIGCHQGYMTVKLSRVVGEKGKVLAVDIDTYQLSRLRENLEKRKIENVEVIEGKTDDPLLGSETCDAILILDTYHEIEDYEEVLAAAKRALRPYGRLVICDPIATANRGKDRSSQTRKHELSLKYARQEMEMAGFEIAFQQDPFIDRMDPKGDVLWAIVGVKGP